jgi:hypothetical protein
VGDKHLPGVDNLCQRDRLVALPRLKLLGALDKDNEVLVLALVVYLCLLVVSAGHDCWVGVGSVEKDSCFGLLAVEQ